jgi:hypothetical protein
MPVRLSATALIYKYLNGCGGQWWDVSGRALNLMEAILSTFTLSALTHKLNASGRTLTWRVFLVLVCGTPAQNLLAHFNYTVCTHTLCMYIRTWRPAVAYWCTMLQAGRSPVRVPDEVDFYNLLNPSSLTMALGSTEPLTEMSTRNLPGGKKRPALRADNLAAICEPNVWKCGSLNLSQP